MRWPRWSAAHLWVTHRSTHLIVKLLALKAGMSSARMIESPMRQGAVRRRGSAMCCMASTRPSVSTHRRSPSSPCWHRSEPGGSKEGYRGRFVGLGHADNNSIHIQDCNRHRSHASI